MQHDKRKRRGAGTDASTCRARLVDTARQLFTQRGAANVGINDVIDSARVALMTLYNNFPSKEALIVAVYQDMADSTLRTLDALCTGMRSERKRIEAFFDHFGKRSRSADFRGCSLIHASFQEEVPLGPVYAVVQTYKRALRERVYRALDEKRKGRGELADQILILLDGAVTEAYLKGVADAIGAARRAAVALIGMTG